MEPGKSGEMNLLKWIEHAGLFSTGLLAGVFFAFETAVNPGLQRLSDWAYLAAMQHINRVIQNPAFLLVFVLPVLLLSISAWQNASKTLVAAALLYIIAVWGVTIFFNVPLNEQLDRFDLKQASTSDIATMRNYYEKPWNCWHTLRTWAALLAFLLAMLAYYFKDTSTLSAK